MFIEKIKSYGKIGLVLCASFFIANLVNNEIFIGNSPMIRQQLGKYIAMKVKNKQTSISKTIASLFNFQARNAQQLANEGADKAFKALESVPFKQVAQGTYAKSNDSATVTVVKLGEIESVEYTFIIKGQTVKIRVPKDANVTEEELQKQLSGE